MTRAHVPLLPTWLLRCMLPPRDREAMLGDLFEEYALLSSTSPAMATRWYWSQACRSVPAVLATRIRLDEWLLTALVGLGAYVLVGILNGVGGFLVARGLGPHVRAYALSGVIVGLAAIALGGYVAAWIRRGATAVLGALVVIVTVVLIASPRDPAPLWYQLTFLCLGPLAAYAGGAGHLGSGRRIERTK